MEIYRNIPVFYADSRAAWRKWLLKNHKKESAVWLNIYKKASGTPSVNYKEAVLEALCFGWIDSTPNKKDEQSYYQYFAPRNPKSKWSVINKKAVAELQSKNLMHKSGLALVELAKNSGTWDALDDIHAMVLPPELKKLLTKNKIAKQNWDAFPPSTKRGILEWISNAKKDETRTKRILETVTLAEKNIRANSYTKKN